jgi:hypothetical protein
MDYFVNIGISLVLSALKQAVKNPAHKAELRNAMLKIYTQIGIVFGDDPQFVSAAQTNHNL